MPVWNFCRIGIDDPNCYIALCALANLLLKLAGPRIKGKGSIWHELVLSHSTTSSSVQPGLGESSQSHSWANVLGQPASGGLWVAGGDVPSGGSAGSGFWFEVSKP